MDQPHTAIPDFIPPAIMRDGRALRLLHPHAQVMAEVLRALITYGEWTTHSRRPLAKALAGWLGDLVELEHHGHPGMPLLTLRLRPGTTLANHTTAKPGDPSTRQG